MPSKRRREGDGVDGRLEAGCGRRTRSFRADTRGGNGRLFENPNLFGQKCVLNPIKVAVAACPFATVWYITPGNIKSLENLKCITMYSDE